MSLHCCRVESKIADPGMGLVEGRALVAAFIMWELATRQCVLVLDCGAAPNHLSAGEEV